jgi:capsular polysaccharide biosynthesis protein
MTLKFNDDDRYPTKNNGFHSIELNTLDVHKRLSPKLLQETEIISLKNIINIDTDNKEIYYVELQDSFFHFLLEDMSNILYNFNLNKDIVFILNAHNVLTSNQPQVPWLLKLFKFLDINFILLNFEKGKNLIIKDFYSTNNDSLYYDHVDNFYHIIQRYKDRYGLINHVGPYRKVYLSRKKISDKSKQIMFSNNNPDNYNFQDDIRVDNEEKIEQYFSNFGFEIIYPEEFHNFDDQIDYFDTVKTLVSLTSAGLSNALFMRPGQMLVELSVPLIVDGRESIHTHYQGLSFAKNHRYISIPSMRNSDDIIGHIENNLKLKELISNG